MSEIILTGHNVSIVRLLTDNLTYFCIKTHVVGAEEIRCVFDDI